MRNQFNINFFGGDLVFLVEIWYLITRCHVNPRINFKLPFTMSSFPEISKEINIENYLLLMLCIKYSLTLFISEVRFSRSNNNINIEKEHVRRGLYMQCPCSWASQPVLPTLVVLPIQNTENMIQMYKICWILSHKQNNVFMLYLDRISWTSL